MDPEDRRLVCNTSAGLVVEEEVLERKMMMGDVRVLVLGNWRYPASAWNKTLVAGHFERDTGLRISSDISHSGRDGARVSLSDCV